MAHFFVRQIYETSDTSTSELYICLLFQFASTELLSFTVCKYMKQSIGYVSLLVRAYDEAIAFYTKLLDFEVIEDTPLGDGKRWVLVAPRGSSECRILLAKANKKDELDGIGRQAGGRVFLFLHTDDFWRDFRTYSLRGVQFCEQPRKESYGTVAVFVDVCGNRWDLLQLKKLPNPESGVPRNRHTTHVEQARK